MRETAATEKASARKAKAGAADDSASEQRGIEQDEAGADGVAVTGDAVAGGSAGSTGKDDSGVTERTEGAAGEAALTAEATDVTPSDPAAVESEPSATEDPAEEPGSEGELGATATEGAWEDFAVSDDSADGRSDSGPATTDLDTDTEFRMPTWAGSGSGRGSAGSDALTGLTGSGRPGPEPERTSLRPPYTRPPGMVPPPDFPDRTGEVGISGPNSLSAAANSPSGAFATLHAAPVSAPPRVTGRDLPTGMVVRPLGYDGTAGPRESTAQRYGEPMRPRPAATPRGPRRARLNLKRVDPWSVMKFSFAVSLVLFIVVIVAASVLYLALDAMGVFASINSTVAELIASGGEGNATFQITARGVIGSAAVLGGLNVLLFTSLATLGAFIYNVCADLVGGVEVTLAERD